MPFVQQRLKDSSTIVTQIQLLATKDAEIVKHIEKEDKLYKLASNVQVKTVYQIKEVLVPYKDSTKVITLKDTINGIIDSTEYLKLPSRVQTIDTNFLLDATVLSNGLEVNYLKIPNTTIVNIGEEGNIFKHQSIIKIHQSNPYILQTDVKNVIIENPKLKNKAWKGFGIGCGVGSVATIVLSVLAHFYIH